MIKFSFPLVTVIIGEEIGNTWVYAYIEEETNEKNMHIREKKRKNEREKEKK